MSLLDRKARKSASQTLSAGSHNVKISKMIETNDQHKAFDGEEIEVKEDWVDATPQLAIVFTSKGGVFTHRFNCKGYKRFIELSKAEQAKCIAVGDEGYAVDKKTKSRIEDPERTDKAFRFIDDLVARTGGAEGDEYQSIVGKEVNITISENEQGNLRVTKTAKVKAEVDAELAD